VGFDVGTIWRPVDVGCDALDVVDEGLERDHFPEIVRGDVGCLEGAFETPEAPLEDLLGVVGMLEKVTSTGGVGNVPTDCSHLADKLGSGRPIHQYQSVTPD